MSTESSTSEPTATSRFICQPSGRMFTSYTLAAAYVHTAPEHATSLTQAVENGTDVDEFVSSVIHIMEKVPNVEAQAIWREELDKLFPGADLNSPEYINAVRYIQASLCVLRPKVLALPVDVPGVEEADEKVCSPVLSGMVQCADDAMIVGNSDQ